MVHILKETVNRTEKRIWGKFKLSDRSSTKFEMIKDEAWFQWGNTTENMYITLERVKKLCDEYNDHF